MSSGIPARRSFGGGFVLCQTTNWNVSKTGSNTSCQRPSRLYEVNANSVPVGLRTRRNSASQAAGSKVVWSHAATSLLNDLRQLMSMLPVE